MIHYVRTEIPALWVGAGASNFHGRAGVSLSGFVLVAEVHPDVRALTKLLEHR